MRPPGRGASGCEPPWVGSDRSADRDAPRRLIAERKGVTLRYSGAADAALTSRSRRLLRGLGLIGLGLIGCGSHVRLPVCWTFLLAPGEGAPPRGFFLGGAKGGGWRGVGLR